jgi:hypothetical protein
MNRKLVYFRKVYVFVVEHFDPKRKDWERCGIERRDWLRCGMVLLPDNAYREELASALLVFGLRAPRPSDRVAWDYDTQGWIPGAIGTPLPRPRARISDLHGTPIVRLSAREKNVHELGRKKL